MAFLNQDGTIKEIYIEVKDNIESAIRLFRRQRERDGDQRRILVRANGVSRSGRKRIKAKMASRRRRRMESKRANILSWAERMKQRGVVTRKGKE